MNSVLKQFYDGLYEKNPGIFGDSSRAWLEHVLLNIPKHTGFALDIGAGEGQTSLLLAHAGYTVDAVDFSNNALKPLLQTDIRTHIMPIEEFPWNHSYNLIHHALIAHHLEKELFGTLTKTAQTHTLPGGVHVLRLFTKNSDFFKQSDGSLFFDDGTSVNNLYKDWAILLDEHIQSPASTEHALNEIRQVVFQKQM